MNDLETAGKWVRLALDIGRTVTEVVFTAMRNGDTRTLEALHEVLADANILAARDLALEQSQRQLAFDQLRRRDGEP